MDFNDTLKALRQSLSPDTSDTDGAPGGNDGAPYSSGTPSDSASGDGSRDLTGITATLHFERKGRGGSPATIISGLGTLPDARLKALASTLKSKLAVGGSCRGGEILVQGDRRAQLRALLPALGISRVKG